MATKRAEEIIREVEGERLIGASPAMQQVIEDIVIFAPLDVVVVLLGETGVGKDLVARLIHANSPRRNKPFVAINCANLQDDLLESECFGSTKGAFTGAETRDGLFHQADGGTLYLNELQDLSRRNQAKLKEFLDRGRIRPVGAARAVTLDVRVIVATNGNLEQMVEEKQLVRDFYERLGCHRIHIRPLRERRKDIPLLVEYFLERMSREYKLPTKGLTTEAQRVLMEQSWPGNVRELKKVVEAAWFRGEGSKIEAADVTRALQPWDGQRPSPGSNHNRTGVLVCAIEEHGLKAATEAQEREALEQLLATSPSLREAARRAGLRLSTLQYKISKHGLTDVVPHHDLGGGRNNASNHRDEMNREIH